VNDSVEDNMAGALQGKSETWPRNLGFLVMKNSRWGTLKFKLELVSIVCLTGEAHLTHD